MNLLMRPYGSNVGSSSARLRGKQLAWQPTTLATRHHEREETVCDAFVGDKCGGAASTLRMLHGAPRPEGPLARATVEAGPYDTAIPFLGDVIRVSGYLQDELRRVVGEAGFGITGEDPFAYAPASTDLPPALPELQQPMTYLLSRPGRPPGAQRCARRAAPDGRNPTRDGASHLPREAADGCSAARSCRGTRPAQCPAAARAARPGPPAPALRRPGDRPRRQTALRRPPRHHEERR
jgi:hypothetical protein